MVQYRVILKTSPTTGCDLIEFKEVEGWSFNCTVQTLELDYIALNTIKGNSSYKI